MARTLDEWLERASSDSIGDTLGWLDKFATAVLNREEATWEALFDPTLDANARRRVAIALLRLLAANDSIFEERSFRLRALDLMDAELTDVYSEYSLDAKQQTYEKLRDLRGHVPSVESHIDVELNLPSTSAGIPNYRQQAMKCMKSRRVSAIISPFVERKIVQSTFDAALEAADSYVNSPTEHLQLSWTTFQRVSKDTLDVLESHDSVYARVGMANAIRGVQEVLERDFVNSPANMRATVRVTSTEKRYPLHQPGEYQLYLRVRNHGPGIANDVLIELSELDGLEAESSEIFLGNVGLSEITVSATIRVPAPVALANVLCTVNWRNANGDNESDLTLIEVARQRDDIDWQRISLQDAYALEPIESDQELVGRDEILDRIEASQDAASVGNAYIFGQRRVGKTSIARTVMTRLHGHDSDHQHRVLYLEAGDYVTSDPAETVAAMGTLICSELRHADNRFTDLEVPTFVGALAPLSQFLQACLRRDPTFRLTLMLDEFDLLPQDLFKRTEVGDAFFQTLRSISGKRPFGVVLIGGENMQAILGTQGDALNKFAQYRIDYFDRATQWTEFTRLVRSPVSEWLEISDDGVDAWFEYSDGNPFFANLVGRSVVALALERRDAHVTRTEVVAASQHAVRNAGSPSFAHFWKDGIPGTGPETETLSIVRRKVLLGMSECLRNGQPCTLEAVAAGARRYGLSVEQTRRNLESFVDRHVLVMSGETYRCRVPLFEEWLRERGPAEIVTSSPDLESYQDLLELERESYVSDGAIVDLVSKWGPFKGEAITSERVRAWLDQFGSAREGRLMFQLLQGIHFYNGGEVRSRLRDAHSIVRRSLNDVSGDRYGRGKERRDDIVLSHLDAVGKSGVVYARWYADENGVYVDNVVAKGDLVERLADSPETKAVVFVDDFIGSGRSGADYVADLALAFSDGLPDLTFFLIAITGFDSGAMKIRRRAEEIGFPLTVRICDPLSDKDLCFESAEVYPEPDDRQEAKEVAYKYGVQLVPTDPYGFGRGQSLVVFDSSIPNNCPPILWQQKGGWQPLFRRI